ACETVCPSKPRKAILVEGRAVQDLARVLEGRAGAAAQNAPLVLPELKASGQSGAAEGNSGFEGGEAAGSPDGAQGGSPGGSDGFPF
ncbi:MAG: hypothetical protein JNG85_06585, partial [Spirochaetaceae bacterium]|nr:hypothetical protein [Spirochaetaceae bacterium]